MSPPTRRLIAILLPLAMLLAACSSDPGSPATGPGEDQPGVGGDLVSGALADVPVPDAADPTGGTVEEEGRQTQAYIVTATSPQEVQAFYSERLPDLGWEELSREDLAEGARSTWSDGDRELLIAASPDDLDTSLSLQVTDLGADPPGVDGS